MASDPAALELLKQHEVAFDKKVRALSVLQLPLRSVLSGLFLVVDNRFHGDRAGRVPMRQVEAGYALVSRLSYILPLLAGCPVEPDGESASDALSVIGATELQELRTLALYAHFCELMPEVHRGYYDVTVDPAGVVLLRHPTSGFAEAEVEDTVMTEAASGFFGGPPAAPASFFDQRVAEGSTLNYGAMVAALHSFYEHYRHRAFEVPILTEAGFRAAVGCGPDEFDRFRAGWMALTEYCLGMADACARRMRSHPQNAESLTEELLEWVAVYLKRNFVDGTIIGLSKLAPDAYDRLLDVFSCEPASTSQHAGDGFFPPIIRFPKAHLFNPDAVRAMLAARNIAYAVNRSDKERFSKTVAADLEPSLIAAAMPSLSQIPGTEIVSNVQWERGEIDVLLFRASENAAVHIQAKGALPPQGARMVQAVESRVTEGLDQLRRLRDATQAERDRALSVALKREVSGVAVVDAVLCRAGMGTAKTWQRMAGIAALNPPLLRAISARFTSEPSLGLREFASVTAATLKALTASAFEGWEHETLAFGELRVSIPLMRLNLERLHGARAKLFVE